MMIIMLKYSDDKILYFICTISGIGIYLFAASWILFLFGILAIVFFARNYPWIHTGTIKILLEKVTVIFRHYISFHATKALSTYFFI